MTSLRLVTVLIVGQLLFASPGYANTWNSMVEKRDRIVSTCLKLVGPKPVSERFRDALKSGDWYKVNNILWRNHERTRARMRNEMTDDEYRQIRKEWAGMSTGHIMATPVEKLVEIFENADISPGSTMVDIGSGYGDPAFVFSALDPSLEVIGFDLVRQKVEEATAMAEALEIPNVEFRQQDLSEPDFQLPEADVYYLYNPATEKIIFQMGRQIRRIAKRQPVKVISYGKGWTSGVFDALGFPVYKQARRGRAHEVVIFEMGPDTKPRPFQAVERVD